MDKSAVSRVIGVWREFCTYEDGSSTGKMWVDDKYEKFTYSQLVEMLPLKDTERRKVRSDMTVSQIREFKKKLKGERSSTEKKEKEEVATSQPGRIALCERLHYWKKSKWKLCLLWKRWNSQLLCRLFRRL